MKKRMLAWLLTAAMTISQFPVAAFATETTPMTQTVTVTEGAEETNAPDPIKATDPKSADPAKAAEEANSTEPAKATKVPDPSESTVETSAPTEETTEPTEGTTAPTEETTEPTEGTTAPTEETTETVDEAVVAVVARIAALPELEVLEGLDADAQSAAYEQAQTIADAYDALTEDQQGQVSNFETLKAFLAWFAVPETMVDGTVKVTSGNDETTYYGDPADVIKYCSDGDIITLLNGYTTVTTDGTPVTIDKSITLDLGGNTWTLNTGLTLNNEITVKNGTLSSVVTIGDSGNITLNNVTGMSVLQAHGGTVAVSNGDGFLDWRSPGKLTVNSGSNYQLTVHGDVSKGDVTLNGGTFTKILVADAKSIPDTFKNMLPAGYAYQYISDNSMVKLSELTGNTLTNVKVIKCTTHSYVNGVCAYCGDICGHKAVDSDNKCTACKMEMAVKKADGSAYYPTLNAALAQDGDYVLLKDVAEDVATSISGSLDLNGKKITGSLARQGREGTLTLKRTGEVDYLSVAGSALGVCLEGGTYGTIMAQSTVGSLLADGYAFTDANGNYISNLGNTFVINNVTVVKCTHAGSDSSPCPYCNTALEASITVGTTTTGYASFEDALAAANGSSGSTLKLLANASTTKELEATGTFTLDVNSHSLSVDALILDGGNLTVKDSGTGGTIGEAILIQNNGTLQWTSGSSGTMAGVTVQGGSITVSSGAIDKIILKNGTNSVTVNGGNVHIATGDYDEESINTINVTNGTASINVFQGSNTITVSGGEVSKLEMGTKMTASISGGTFGEVKVTNGTVRDLLADGYAFYEKPVDGTDYTRLVNAAVTELNGSCQVKTHTHSYVDGACDCGYSCPHTTVANNKCETCELTFVAQLWRNNAQVGWLTKVSDDEGLASVIKAGDTVKLMTNFGVNEEILITKDITLDLNNHNCEIVTLRSNATIIDSTVTVDGKMGGKVNNISADSAEYTLTMGKGTCYGAASGMRRFALLDDQCGLYDIDTKMYANDSQNFAVLKNPTSDWTITFTNEVGETVETDKLVYGKTYTAMAKEGTYVPTGAAISYQWSNGNDNISTQALSTIPAITLEGSTNQQSVTFKATNVSGLSPFLTCKITVNGFEISKTEALKVNPADIPTDYYTVPTANTLVYKGEAQELVTAGTVKANKFTGQVEYRLGEDGTWSKDVPKQMDVGTYKVYWRIVSGNAAYKNYEAAEPITVSITNDWKPVNGTEFTTNPAPSADGWLKDYPTVCAKAGYEVSIGNNASSAWDSEMGIDLSADHLMFYVRSETTGAISLGYTCKVDSHRSGTNTSATVSATGMEGSWTGLVDTVNFGTLLKDDVTVTVTATDSVSGVKKVEYLESATVLTEAQLQNQAGWRAMSATANENEHATVIKAEDGKQFVCYIRVTDKAGNATYFSTNGGTFDTVAPTISGVTNNQTTYTTRKVTISDPNLAYVKLDGDVVYTKPEVMTLSADPVTTSDSGYTLTLTGNKDHTYVIETGDTAKNVYTYNIKMQSISTLTAAIKGLTTSNVTSANKTMLQSMSTTLASELSNPNATDEEKAALQQAQATVTPLTNKLDTVASATNTDNTQKAEGVTASNVKLNDKDNLEKAQADLEKALKDHASNLTEAEKKELNGQLDTYGKALKAIENVENVETLIGNLPKTITSKASKEVKAAEKAYNDLTAHEKALVSQESVKKLLNAGKVLNRLNGNSTSASTGDESHVNWWFITLLLSAAALLVLSKKRKAVK